MEIQRIRPQIGTPGHARVPLSVFGFKTAMAALKGLLENVCLERPSHPGKAEEAGRIH
jgi:hypothetical protein